MSNKEIKELRQSGKLDEALQMATQALEADPGNIWNKRAIAWVYYDFLKKYSTFDSIQLFKDMLLKIKELMLPEDEKMVFDSCAWQIGSLIFRLQKADQIDSNTLDELFELVKEFHFTRPSEAYSFIFKSFHKCYQNWPNYAAFVDWWNLDNLRSEDYLKEKFEEREIMSLAEQAYIAYSKKLLEGIQNANSDQQRVVYKDKTNAFLPKLDSIITKHEEYLYPPYFKAKLLLALGGSGNVLTTFLPFARQKRNDFWVWQLMAEIFSNDKDLQLACYCKALSLRTPEDFIINVRIALAQILIEKKLYNEAKTEIAKVIATRESNKWPVPALLKHWTELEWYKNANSKSDNKDFYSKYTKNAEEVLFQDIPEEDVVVEFVNEHKSILTFVKDMKKFGFFNYSGHLQNPQIGDILSVRFNGEGRDGFYKLLTAKKNADLSTTDAIKDFEGVLKIILQQNFGFIDDVFIEPALIQKSNFTSGMLLIGRGILSFNKKKGAWGWKAIQLEKKG